MPIKTALFRNCWEFLRRGWMIWPCAEYVFGWYPFLFIFIACLNWSACLRHVSHKPFKRMCKWTSDEDNSCYGAWQYAYIVLLSWRLVSFDLCRLCKWIWIFAQAVTPSFAKIIHENRPLPWKATSIIRIAWWNIRYTELNNRMFIMRLILAELCSCWFNQSQLVRRFFEN